MAGGLFESVRRLGQSLVDQGVSVEVFACRDRYSDEDKEKWLPLRPHLFDPLPPKAFSYSPGLLPGLTASDTDIIHCHGIWMYPSAANLMHWKKRRVPYVISPHGMLDPWAVHNSRWKKELANVLYQKAHFRNAAFMRALCHSEAKAIRAYGLTNPICVIPNGIDLVKRDNFSSPPWEGKVEGGKRVLFYLGRIHPKKGLANLLKAWAALSPVQRHEWGLIIAGWDQGGHEAELKKLSFELGIGKEVLFAGPLFGEEKAAAYHHADAFVLPSFSEGLPMVILEAWAYRLPVVMTHQCNLPEGFATGAALAINPEVGSIAEGLASLFTMTASERALMGDKGFCLVKTSFTWTTIAMKLVKVYRSILGEAACPEELLFSGDENR